MALATAAAGSGKLLSRLRLKQFRLIKGVSEGLSFRQLADRMALSQPAISKMAREMEDTLGAAVFERHRDGVSLTAFGQSLVHDARLIVNKLARLEPSWPNCDAVPSAHCAPAPRHTPACRCCRAPSR